jgi:predicted RNA-binding protein with RPS1 domain
MKFDIQQQCQIEVLGKKPQSFSKLSYSSFALSCMKKDSCFQNLKTSSSFLTFFNTYSCVKVFAVETQEKTSIFGNYKSFSYLLPATNYQQLKQLLSKQKSICSSKVIASEPTDLKISHRSNVVFRNITPFTEYLPINQTVLDWKFRTLGELSVRTLEYLKNMKQTIGRSLHGKLFISNKWLPLRDYSSKLTVDFNQYSIKDQPIISFNQNQYNIRGVMYSGNLKDLFYNTPFNVVKIDSMTVSNLDVLQLVNSILLNIKEDFSFDSHNALCSELSYKIMQMNLKERDSSINEIADHVASCPFGNSKYHIFTSANEQSMKTFIIKSCHDPLKKHLDLVVKTIDKAVKNKIQNAVKKKTERYDRAIKQAEKNIEKTQFFKEKAHKLKERFNEKLKGFNNKMGELKRKALNKCHSQLADVNKDLEFIKQHDYLDRRGTREAGLLRRKEFLLNRLKEVNNDYVRFNKRQFTHSNQQYYDEEDYY